MWPHWGSINFLNLHVTSLELKKYYIVSTTTLMIFTQTEFRIILCDVSGVPKKKYLERSFLGLKEKK